MTATRGYPWRLIIDGPAPGPWNMAVDRAILMAHEQGAAPPTLRLYQWDRPTVSLGRFQKLTDVDRSAIVRRGVGICRRPTGGRGVLHDDELTYSMVAGVDDGVPRGVSASYNLLCGALVEAYRQLGVDAALTEGRRGEQGSPACYLHATLADLSLGAAKLSGSAQVWSGSSVLQHGSFVVSRDVEREAEVFGLDAAARQRLEESTCTIREARRDTPGTEELVRSVVTGVERALGVVVRPGRLSAEELSMAIELEPGFTVDEGSWT